MKIEQKRWTDVKGWESRSPDGLRGPAHLALVFGSTSRLGEPQRFEEIKKMYPKAHILGCSTAGEICGVEVTDDSIVCTAVQFEKTEIKGSQINIDDASHSFEAGKKLADSMDKNGLAHVFVLSDGLKVNGSELVKGLTQNLPQNVGVTGGLSGDGARFKETLVFWDTPPQTNRLAVLGFYGAGLKIGCASLGGWDSFGPERLITRSKGNILYELDGKSALDLYKEYLGEHAKGLPATGLLFPLSLRNQKEQTAVVRTILSVGESEKSMTFAGDVPEGSYVRLMKANFDRLIEGAVGAAKASGEKTGGESPELAVLISCVGRKLILKQRIEEEVEGVREVLGDKTALTGFYSYGEISPFTPNAKCELHNQTMTITTFSER